MCRRARCTLRPDAVARACHLEGAASVRQVDVDRFRPSYNVAPGAYLSVLRREDGGDGGAVDVVQCMKSGLVPSFSNKDEKPDQYRMFNARCESIREKASFRRLVPKNRCIVAVEGVPPVITSGSQISLKSDLKPISKFFSKEVDKPKVPVKLMKGSDESKPDAEVTCKSSRIKAEPDVPAHMEVHEYSKVKRDFENFQAATGSDPRSNEISKPPETPAKKRANIKSSPGDKQPTLLSYFGKS